MNAPRPSRLYEPVQVNDELRIRYLDPKVQRKRARARTLWGKILETGEVGVLTAVLFGGFLVFFNFPSYLAQVSFWWNTSEREETEALLRGITEGTVFVPLQERAVTDVIDTDIPPLKQTVTPPDNRIIIPKIGKNVPIQEAPIANLIAEDWVALEEDIQKSLENGVVRYPGTAVPGDPGNVFITGHSSYYFWAPGEYKDVFALLPNLEVGDKIIIYYNQEQYEYIIQEKKTVTPTDVDVLKQGENKQLTLMTCVPIGTNLNRLILVAEQV